MTKEDEGFIIYSYHLLETWQDTGAQNQKFDDLDDEQEEGGLLDGCDDWEEWSEKSEEVCNGSALVKAWAGFHHDH